MGISDGECFLFGVCLAEQFVLVFFFVIRGGKHAERVAPVSAVKTLVKIKFGETGGQRVFPGVYSQAGGCAVPASAHERKDAFAALK